MSFIALLKFADTCSCIVNGPGEMADADFGYVGGAPGKIDLYVGKEVQQIVQRLCAARLILSRAYTSMIQKTQLAPKSGHTSDADLH